MKRRFVNLLTFILAAVMSVFVFACEKKDPYYAEQPTEEEVSVDGSYRMYTRGEYVDGITLSLDNGVFVYKMEKLLSKAGTYSRNVNELQFTAIGESGAQLYMWGRAYEGIIKLGFYNSNGVKDETFVYMCKDGYAPDYPEAPDGSFILNEMSGANKYVYFSVNGGSFEFVDYGTKTTGRVTVLDGETLFVVGESTFLRGKQIDGSYIMEYDGKKVWFTKAGGVVNNVFGYTEVKDADGAVVSYVLDSFTPGTGDSVEVPTQYNGKPVTKVGENLFSGYAGKSITIPGGVTEIGTGAFSSTAAAVSLPATLTELGDRAFSDYRGNSITLPDALTSLGQNVFSGSGAAIVWGDAPTIKVIGMFAFADYRGSSIKIPDSVELLGWGSFSACRAVIEWGDAPSLKTIDSFVFSKCPFRTITLPATLNRIEKQAFDGCPDLVTVTFEDSASAWEATNDSGTKKTLTVIDPASNALYLTDDYCEYQWKRT